MTAATQRKTSQRFSVLTTQRNGVASTKHTRLSTQRKGYMNLCPFARVCIRVSIITSIFIYELLLTMNINENINFPIPYNDIFSQCIMSVSYTHLDVYKRQDMSYKTTQWFVDHIQN